MVEILNYLINKLPEGWIISFKVKTGFYENSKNKGKVIDITIVNDLGMQETFGITAELIKEFTIDPNNGKIFLDEPMEKIFNELKR